jgi:hypothetical protein
MRRIASTAIAWLTFGGTAHKASSGSFTERRIAALKNMHMRKSSNPAGGRV